MPNFVFLTARYCMAARPLSAVTAVKLCALLLLMTGPPPRALAVDGCPGHTSWVETACQGDPDPAVRCELPC